MKSKTKKTIAHALRPDESPSLQERIARRARQLSHQRRRGPSTEVLDWLQAEREVNEWHQQGLRNSG